jgi:hypothetical protein
VKSKMTAILSSLTQVGPAKSIGYLPLDTIRNILQMDARALADEAEANGQSVMLLGPERCCIKSGALYVFDKQSLETLLNKYARAAARVYKIAAMDTNRQAAPTTPPTGNPDVAPLSGIVPSAFDARPLARSLFVYAFALLVGYCAVIAWAQSQYPAALVWWLDLWTPVVDVFRLFLPIFDRFDSALAAKGVANRAPVIDHLIAVGWLITIPVFAFFTWTVWRLSHEELVRFVTNVPSHRLAIMFFASVLFFLFSLAWIVLGFELTSGNPLWAFHRNNWALPNIGLFFVGVILGGIGFQISLRALIVEGKLKNGQERTD